MNKSKQALGLLFKHGENQMAVTYYLLRPKEAELDPGALELGESITIVLQKECKMAMLTSRYKEGEKKGMWGYQYNHRLLED